MHDYAHWLMHYGYGALFLLLVAGIVGIPVPDETLLTLAGYLVYRGKFDLAPMLLAGFLGSACGITLSYLIGRTAGLYTVHKFGRFLRVDDSKLLRVRLWFERFGKWVLVFGYFIPGIRHFTALVAGASRLPYREFAPSAYLGALLWSTLFIELGYIFGRNWKRIARELQLHQLEAVLVLAVGLMAYALFRYVRARRPKPSAT